MSVSTEISFESIDHLFLDPMNPRLGRHRRSRKTPQDRLLEIMKTWVIEELALSYLESEGFWTHEPLIVVAEELYGKERLVVVEGNRRLAALKYLRFALDNEKVPPKWEAMISDYDIPVDLFDKVPHVMADSREDVQAFLGFRHVTGIKQWGADEKACFIATLIDKNGFTYKQVARKIGSQAPTVRKHYIAYRLLLQAENVVDEFESIRAEERFALLYMMLGTAGAKQYLHIDGTGEPKDVKEPVPKEHFPNLANFCRWLFGTSKTPNLVTDTRQVAYFGRILESKDAVEYLEKTQNPRFEVALRVSGGDEEETIRYIRDATHNIELALMRAHAFKDSVEMQETVKRFGNDALQLLNIFPKIKQQLGSEDEL